MNDDNNLYKQILRGRPKLPYINPSDIDFKDVIESLFVKKKEEIKDNTKKQYVINVYNKYCKKLKLKKNDKSIIMFIKDILYYAPRNYVFVELKDSSTFTYTVRENINEPYHGADYKNLYIILNSPDLEQFFKDLKDK